MSRTDASIDLKSLEILDAAIRRNSPLTQFLPTEEILCQIQSGRAEMQRLADALRDPPPVAMWLKDPVLAKYLPIVLRLQDGSIDDPGRAEAMQRLLTGETNDRAWKWTPWIYPSVVVLATFLVAILLGTTIVPTFKQMFLEFGLRLPAATKWLIWLSDSFILHPIESIGVVIGLMALLGLARFGLRWIEDRIPSETSLADLLSGSRRQVMGMARWTGSLAEMLQLGIPMPQAIALAGTLSGKRSLETQSIRLAHRTQNGQTKGRPVRALGFSPVAIAALQYPDSRKRVALLRSLSDLYWNRAMNRSRASAGWIAPTAVVFIGAFVAFVVLALFMPLLSLVTSLSG
jgi:type IV pilus assembly protein PilC